MVASSPSPDHHDAFDTSRLALLDYSSSETWSIPHQRRAIMAGLVKAVYRMEKDRSKGLWKDPQHEQNARTLRWWKTFHYKMVHLLTDGDVVFGAVFHNGEYATRGAPKVVVALRGTLISKMDVEADVHILLHRLCEHKRFDMVLQVIRLQVAQVGPWDVCLAGHSKGAALALLVGRKLAEEGYNLEAHLFNPPNPRLPSEPFHLPPALTLTASVAHNMAANALAHVFQGQSMRDHDRNMFSSVQAWLPNLYINSKDPFCSAYLDYFEVRRQLPELKEKWFGSSLSRTPHSIRSILGSSISGRDCRPDHLIPSASLHVVHEASSMYLAHKLDQWLNLDLHLSPLHLPL